MMSLLASVTLLIMLNIHMISARSNIRSIANFHRLDKREASSVVVRNAILMPPKATGRYNTECFFTPVNCHHFKPRQVTVKRLADGENEEIVVVQQQADAVTSSVEQNVMKAEADNKEAGEIVTFPEQNEGKQQNVRDKDGQERSYMRRSEHLHRRQHLAMALARKIF